MTRLDVTTARKNLSKVTSRVEYANERFIIQRHGKDAVAVISMKELRLLDRMVELLENRSDLRAARTALAANEERISDDDLRRELGLLK